MYIDLHIQHRVYKNKDQGLLKTYLNYKLVMKERIKGSSHT